MSNETTSPLACPLCQSRQGSAVVDSRSHAAVIRRRRECLGCHARFTTYETCVLTDHQARAHTIATQLRELADGLEHV